MRGKVDKILKEFMYTNQLIGNYADLYFLTNGKVRDGPEVFSLNFIEENLISLLEKRRELELELEKFDL